MKSPLPHSINVRGRLLSLSTPRVMGIMNITPDSFFAGSRAETDEAIALRLHQMTAEGADIIDVGACSTRPGSEPVSEADEMARLRHALTIVRREQPEAVLSVDTFRPDVARMCVEEFGADIINDVGLVPDRQPMFSMVARLRVPYILMSSAPTMRDMLLGFAADVQALRDKGARDIIIDPGFGFGKTLAQNYAIMSRLERLHVLELPLLVGVSRKSMLYRLLDTSPEEVLNGTTVLNTIALQKGAHILRVHDVRQAVEAVKLTAMCTTPPTD